MKQFFAFFFLFALSFAQAQDHLSPSRAAVDESLFPFYHGVASGDPLADRVILWTRITSPNPTETVTWKIATDTGFTNVVNSGSFTTDSSRDYTVKVDATDLQANTWYYYRFYDANNTPSITGRTRTMPNTTVNNLRFAVVACSNYQSGYFNAYRDIALKNDVDAVIHLGDYYYEYGPSDFDPGIDSSRLQEPYHEVLNRSDYRQRHSFYKLDEDLRYVHQQYPFIAVWDDHETANNSWYGGAGNHDSTEGDWFERKEDSRIAYFEWMPIRDVHQSVDTIHRTIPLGGLADLIMIDSRLEGREQQAGTTGATVTDTARTLLGPAQMDWLRQQLSNSTAQWKIIGNQVMISPLKVLGTALNEDQWDGYPAERTRLLSHIADNNIDNVVVLTGDIHTSWANDVPVNPGAYNASTGAGSTCVEYVCTSITSGSFINFTVPVSIIQTFNPNIKYAELSKRGYLVLDVTPQKVQGDWVYMSTITNRSYTATTAASWCDLNNANHLTQCGSALTPRGTNPMQAPVVTGLGNTPTHDMIMISCYPNPTDNEVAVQYYLSRPADVQMTLTDLNGKVIMTQKTMRAETGSYNQTYSLAAVASGTYLLTIYAGGQSFTKRIVKMR